MPKVSVIVPIFRVEQYIARCARSLFEQTLDDIEFVFVNDCTPDDSISILNGIIDEYPSRKPFVKLVSHSSNKGPAITRKTGLEAASGEYIAFCDSDDWVSDSMYELLYGKAVETGSDMVICGYCVSDGDRVCDEFPVCPTDNPLRDLLSDAIPNFTWTKLIRRDIFNNEITFPEGSIHEDTCLICQIAYYCKKISIVPQPLYYYYRNEEGLCLSELSESRFLGARDNIVKVVAFLKEKGLDRLYKAEIENIECRIPRLSTLLPQKLFRKYNAKIHWKVFFNKYCPVKEKLGYATKLMGIHGISKCFKSRSK